MYAERGKHIRVGLRRPKGRNPLGVYECHSQSRVSGIFGDLRVFTEYDRFVTKR